MKEKNKKLREIMVFLAEGIMSLKENECKNSGQNWYGLFELLLKDLDYMNKNY